LKSNSKLEDVLSISLKDVLERRLETLVYKKAYAKTMKQARQFISHEHISIGEKTITAPSYLVKVSEESLIGFNSNSPFIDTEHPTRKVTLEPVVEQQVNN
jgi:small subunit ribosomal protein S4